MPFVKSTLLFPLRILAAILIILSEILRPLYQPLIRLISGLSITLRLEAAIASMPPYGILILLLAPVGIVEPLKFYGLILLAKGMLIRGGIVTITAHLLSFLLIERIYTAGKPKLLAIKWFAVIIGWLAALRDRIIDTVKETPLWGAIIGMKEFMGRIF